MVKINQAMHTPPRDPFGTLARLTKAAFQKPADAPVSIWLDAFDALERLPLTVPLESWALLRCRLKNARLYAGLGVDGPSRVELTLFRSLLFSLSPDPQSIDAEGKATTGAEEAPEFETRRGMPLIAAPHDRSVAVGTYPLAQVGS